eukprot:CAMPEP_0183344934 /NCGR_PEP_ID=MMETSP0164_2-20130417/10503_1 /TAXON_ID=221442 /ORGANISM="Coccolithus pelagicus ssp braarudi, Strain PLY182g" /LENGTH=123 /DNA_ID=CAMNT_0025516017 /DNA_START=233 /DNA_END=602 /DNA_ORIENTATION=+
MGSSFTLRSDWLLRPHGKRLRALLPFGMWCLRLRLSFYAMHSRVIFREAEESKTPRGSALPLGDARRADGDLLTTRPLGKIRIEQLYLNGVYEDQVLGWLTLADAACAAIVKRLRGEEVDIPR